MQLIIPILFSEAPKILMPLTGIVSYVLYGVSFRAKFGLGYILLIWPNVRLTSSLQYIEFFQAGMGMELESRDQVGTN